MRARAELYAGGSRGSGRISGRVRGARQTGYVRAQCADSNRRIVHVNVCTARSHGDGGADVTLSVRYHVAMASWASLAIPLATTVHARLD